MLSWQNRRAWVVAASSWFFALWISLAVAQDAGRGAAGTAAQPTDKAASAPAADAEPTEEEQPLPLLAELPLPSDEELLGEVRRDWIVLQDERVLVVEPVYPRPETLAKIQAERDAILSDSRQRFSAPGRLRLTELTKLPVFLPEDESSTEYLIDLREIREILHHEDLMLRRADQLIEAGDTRKAFELLFVVSRRDPQWPGLAERQVKVTAIDADRFLNEKDADRAIALIEALYERKPVPDVADNLLERAAAIAIGESLEQEDYRRARYELARIRKVDPRHLAVEQWQNRLIERARSHRTAAETAAAASDDALAAAEIEKAAMAWPTLSGLRPLHARLTSRYQRLTVGVSSLASATSLALPTTADDRVERLTTADLFEVDDFNGLPSYRSVYFEHWEPTDLGRRARFECRQTLPTWAARPPIVAPEAVRFLGQRLQPEHPAYDSRFADLVDSLRVSGPFAFEVVFKRIPLRAEAALSRPPLSTVGTRAPAEELFQRFLLAERNEQVATYRRAVPESSPGERHVAEIVEVAFPSYEKAVQAFDRGEVRMLADLPAWDVPRLREDKRFLITKLAVPRTHLLQFHPESEPLKSTEVRRAIALSADAADLLRIVTGEGAEAAGRLVTAPYPSTHLGYDPLVQPRRPDLPLAVALTLAAQKRFGGAVPEIVFAAPAEQPVRQVAETLAATWKRIGLPVRLVTFEELGENGRWDVAYRELAIADPIAALAPLITLDSRVDVTSLAELPHWLRQRLLDLERAGDATTAQAVIIDLHRLLHADVRCVPLFEVDQFLASRSAIRGLPERPVAVYQHAERWILPTEYPEDAR